MQFIVFPTDLKYRTLVNEIVGKIAKRAPEKDLHSKDFLGRRSVNGANLPYE